VVFYFLLAVFGWLFLVGVADVSGFLMVVEFACIGFCYFVEFGMYLRGCRSGGVFTLSGWYCSFSSDVYVVCDCIRVVVLFGLPSKRDVFRAAGCRPYEISGFARKAAGLLLISLFLW